MACLLDPTNSSAGVILKRASGGVLLAVAAVLVLAVSIAGLLAGGAFLVGGA